MKLRRRLFGILTIYLGILTLGMPGSLAAQTSQGRILGTVTDQSGAMVTGAKIVITNVATSTQRVLLSNGAGDYVALSLDPGIYKVKVEASGFKEAQSAPIVLEVAREIRVDVKLQPGAASQVMEVAAEETLVDTTDSTLNGVLSNKAINELPLQGRDFQNLLALHPGVQRSPGGGFQSITSNGNRPDENNFFVDGVEDNDVYYGESVVNDAGIAGTPASLLPLDAIQEFNTQESPSAEYGAKPGVVVNLGLKSGTNDVHGTAYYFHRNAALDARNYFNPTSQPISAILLHQFGASIGGPIRKDKWFYFFNYEGIRDKVGNPTVFETPVTQSLIGRVASVTTAEKFSVVDAVTGPDGCIANPNPGCSQLSLNLAGLDAAGMPTGKGVLPNNPGLTVPGADPGAIFTDFNNKNRGDNLVAKSDYVFNDRHRVTARFVYSNTDQTEEDAFPLRPEWLSVARPRTQLFGVDWVWTPNSSWINSAHFSYNRFDEPILPGDHNVNPLAYGLNTGVTDPRLFGFPRVSPGGEFNYLGGNSSWPLFTTPDQTNNWSDTVSYTRGKHSLQFGGEYRYGSVKYFRARYGRGRVDFRHLLNFVNGDVRRWRLVYGDNDRDLSLKSYGFFVQDSYRVLPRVTLNLGLRYDVTGPLKDSHNLLANYVPTSATGLVQVGFGISQPYATKYNNVSPRVGFAWDLFGTGRTVLRAGGGLIFEEPAIRTFVFGSGGLNLNPSGLVGNGNLTSFEQVSSDGSLINWTPAPGGPIFPSASVAGNGCSLFNVSAGAVNQCSVFAVNQGLSTPYVANFNFNILQAIGSSAVLQVAYVANNGIKLYSITDTNQVNPNSSLETDPNGPCALIVGNVNCEGPGRPLNENCPIAQGGLGRGGPCFPRLGFFQYLSNQAHSDYNSLQVTFTKKYSHGLYLLAGYTYAHAIDTASSNTAGVPQDSNNYAAERGNGDFDIRHRFTLSATYSLPSKKTKSQLLEGWQVNTLATFEGGMPYSFYDSSNDISGTGELADRWDFSGKASDVHFSHVGSSSIPYIDPTQFNSVEYDSLNQLYHVTNGTNPTAQRCVNQAFANGGQSAADQLIGGPSLVNTGGCFVSGSAVITPPALHTYGNMGRNIFRGPKFINWDFSTAKAFRVSDRVSLQLRGEFFNILNHPNFPEPTSNTDLSDPGNLGRIVFTPDLRASNPVIGSGGSRHIQLGAKVIW